MSMSDIPVEILYIAAEFMAIGVPFVAFFIGVHISTVLKLNGKTDRIQLYWMSIPVALLTIGNLLIATTVNLEFGYQYSHMESASKYLIFIGSVTLLGTLVPQLFSSARSRIIRENTKANETPSKVERAPTGDKVTSLKSAS